MLADNVDQLGAEMATLAAAQVVVLAGAGEEVAEDEAHLPAGDVVAATESEENKFIVQV